jgi:glyoxylase-like metal-dependent hydrolase (beta-lactamase superfamily II)
MGVQASPEPDILFGDGEELTLCECVSFNTLATPGHSPGGACFTFDKAVITGDTLFHMSIGRSDLRWGDPRALIGSIKSRLMTLPEDYAVYPGHGEPTTIGFEKKYNPYVIGDFT